MKSLIHQHLYGFLKNTTYMKWWYFKIVWQYDFLPLYMNIPFSRYRLAVWNCGLPSREKPTGKNGRTCASPCAKNQPGAWMFTIKQGDHADATRCSRHFNPFGVSLHKYFKPAAT